MMLNKDTKSPDRTTGFSTALGAVKWWEINAAYQTSLCSVFHQHLDYSQSYHHKDLSPHRIVKDESDIQSIIPILCDTFIDLFSEQPLLSISTGFVIDNSYSVEILSAKETGLVAMNKFIEEWLSSDCKKSIFDTIKKQKLPIYL